MQPGNARISPLPVLHYKLISNVTVYAAVLHIHLFHITLTYQDTCETLIEQQAIEKTAHGQFIRG